MKAAGTSVTNDLCKHLDWRDLVLGGTKLGEDIHLSYRKHLGIEKHSTAKEVINVVGEDLWNDYFTFSFVRHPYTRTVSLYNYIAHYANKRLQSSLKNKIRHKLGKTIQLERNDWLRKLPEAQAYFKSKDFSSFIRIAHEMGAQGLRPQVESLTDKQDELNIDFIGKVESLDQDLSLVLNRIGLPSTPPSTENRTQNGRSWQSYFKDESDYKFLENVFINDFELLKYDPSKR